MIRLNEVIKLEDRIRNLLELAPTNYMPPICQFVKCPPKKQVTEKKVTPAKSKFSKKTRTVPEVNTESQNNTLFDVLNTQKSVTNAMTRFNAKTKPNFSSLSYGLKEIYR